MNRTIKNIFALLGGVIALMILNSTVPRDPPWMLLAALGLALVAAGLGISAVQDMRREQQIREMFDEPDEHRDNAV